MSEARRQISPERKGLYYTGMTLQFIGVLLFLSVIVSAFSAFGGLFRSGHGELGFDVQYAGMRAIGGIFLMILGGWCRHLGTRGLAGSGILLDPEKARRDLEPWSRMAGGLVDDALSEVGAVKNAAGQAEGEKQVVKIRCRKCGALNDDAAKFCNQCGGAI